MVLKYYFPLKETRFLGMVDSRSGVGNVQDGEGNVQNGPRTSFTPDCKEAIQITRSHQKLT